MRWSLEETLRWSVFRGVMVGGRFPVAGDYCPCWFELVPVRGWVGCRGEGCSFCARFVGIFLVGRYVAGNGAEEEERPWGGLGVGRDAVPRGRWRTSFRAEERGEDAFDAFSWGGELDAFWRRLGWSVFRGERWVG